MDHHKIFRKEEKRLSKLLEDKNIGKQKMTELKRSRNILQSFMIHLNFVPRYPVLDTVVTEMDLAPPELEGEDEPYPIYKDEL